MSLALLATAASSWGAPLDATATSRIASYLAFVREKNQETNLTADDSWEDLVLKHAADGVFAAARLRAELVGKRLTEPYGEEMPPPHAVGKRPPRVLDLGAGAGFIGIVLKIAWPEAEVTLMESVERKYRFLNAALMRLNLPGLRVLNRRAEVGAALTAYESDRDAVVARALAPLPKALRLAWPLLGPRGLFAAFQTTEPDVRAPALSKALAAAGARVLKSCPYRRPGDGLLPDDEHRRRLVIFARREATLAREATFARED